MFLKSIRWRLQLWQVFLLACILSGFGVTAYQLHCNNQLRQIGEKLERRVAALNGDLRRPPPFGLSRGRLPFEIWNEQGTNHGSLDPIPDRPPFKPDLEPPPPRPPGPDARGPHGHPEDFYEPRGIRLSAQTTSPFDDHATNSFFFAIWSRSGALLKASTTSRA
ncbi:MAG: hypothetical protein M1608_10565, partial [Candidatus Omnitrophica bacterium]|nr:hypothetical protein [Candidatus Omnitrophota bacterium]